MSDNIPLSYVTTKLPLFIGKKDAWEQWSEVFLARAKTKGYKHLLVDDSVVIPRPGTTGLSEAEKAIVEKNDEAYGNLISAMDLKKGKVAFAVVKGMKTMEYPDGNVKEAWRKLKANLRQ